MGKQFLMPLYSFWCSLSLCPSVLLSACVCACVCSYVFLCVPVCMCASVRVEMYGVRVQRRLQACASLFPFVLLLLASSSLSWVASRRHTASCCTLCASPSLMCRSPSPGLSMNDRTDRAAFSKPYGSLPNRVLCSYAFVSKLLPSLSLPLPPPPSLPLFFFPPPPPLLPLFCRCCCWTLLLLLGLLLFAVVLRSILCLLFFVCPLSNTNPVFVSALSSFAASLREVSRPSFSLLSSLSSSSFCSIGNMRTHARTRYGRMTTCDLPFWQRSETRKGREKERGEEPHTERERDTHTHSRVLVFLQARTHTHARTYAHAHTHTHSLSHTHRWALPHFALSFWRRFRFAFL